jgi:predicted transcriptional regulator YheO
MWCTRPRLTSTRSRVLSTLRENLKNRRNLSFIKAEMLQRAVKDKVHPMQQSCLKEINAKRFVANKRALARIVQGLRKEGVYTAEEVSLSKQYLKNHMKTAKINIYVEKFDKDAAKRKKPFKGETVAEQKEWALTGYNFAVRTVDDSL